MEVSLNVKELCGTRKVTRPDSEKIKKLIHDAWGKHDNIRIDFDNIRIASVSFLDEAIGLLALEHDLEEIKSKLELVNMNSFDHRLLDNILTSRARLRKSTRSRQRMKATRRSARAKQARARAKRRSAKA